MNENNSKDTESKETESEEQADSENTQSAEEQNDASSEEVDQGEINMEQALEKLYLAEEEAQQAKDDLLRVKAEMQNLRRRTEQDVEKAHKFGQEKFSGELLQVMDNLERSLAAAADSEDEVVKAIHEGVDLTLKSFADCFAKFNIEAVDPLGEPFDPQLHQAMSIQESPEAEPNTVIAVMQKGYTLHGRVIRPAMVMVSK
ncbi:MAG: nucleotide exchange factor GrpE [Gammaproteobacteria bacterium]|nr:nucleotide exchange factor GrpE [Gammaproteobacteria bacterium]MBT3858195.1 nucleotide exchange factor GrpE [Gammaproteobacteria bacterium]MBT3988030.1 nucleotide exchange factor GrpE [Gammaproteobacteria bacterium]MBT4255684.1 nucleotide exchange factor GrpE [Gammaproteobacteria bacterium]MBT4582130.1 nucleotide exchange factor GrpE [Gammaproteobacteria bacterium]